MASEFALTKQFWTGCLYAGIGGFAIYQVQDYRMGTLERMGPGYFPAALAVLLLMIGIACMARAVWRSGERLDAFAWRPLILITAAIFAFAYLLPLLGLPVAMIAMIAIGSYASRSFKPDTRFLIAMAFFVCACIGLFVHGLGVSMPLTGSLLRGIGL